MKEFSERARVLLARYKMVESLSPLNRENLLANLEDAVARGASPQFDDDAAAPIVVPQSWPQRTWSVPLLRPLIVILLLAVPAVVAVGIARRLRPAEAMPLPARALSAPISAHTPPPIH
jgi:hypothetical protein